jgi:iron complex outermembrane receptor protein
VSLLAGTFPSTNPVSIFLGAQPLGPEKSVNWSAGLTFGMIPGVTLTVDGYRIYITDQIYSTSNIPVTPAIRAALLASNIAGANSISNVRFFQNAFNSRTQGFDIVATYRKNWRNGQNTSLVGSFNLNQYDIKKLKIAGLFNATSIYNFRNSNPQWRAVFTASHEIGAFRGLIRANVYGPTTIQADVAPLFPRQHRSTVAQWDTELTYDITEHYSFTVGARNVFDKYPDPNILNASNGSIYSDSVVDFQGGFYFARFDVRY